MILDIRERMKQHVKRCCHNNVSLKEPVCCIVPLLVLPRHSQNLWLCFVNFNSCSLYSVAYSAAALLIYCSVLCGELPLCTD